MPKGKHNSPKPKRIIPKAAEKLSQQLDEMAAPKGNQFSVGHGRPNKEIDWALFENLCNIHCTQSEIASMLKVHPDTLRDNAVKYYQEQDFSTIYKKFQESGKCSLRRNQYVLSKSNATMAIWLGKQYLGQKDIESTITVTPETALQFKNIMDQLERAQLSALNKAETSRSTESTS